MEIPAETFAKARDAFAELLRNGSPVVRAGHEDETVVLAWRRWSSYGQRRNRTDLHAQIEDLAKGLRDKFENEPRLTGPLIEDYRHLASVLASVFSSDDD